MNGKIPVADDSGFVGELLPEELRGRNPSRFAFDKANST
jgi:hypothetical protein